MQRIKISTLVWVFAFGVPVGWLIASTVRGVGNGLPPVPVVLPMLLLALAVAGFVTARAVRGWVAERRHDRYFDALRVARLLSMAKAGAMFGAVVAGVYTGIVLLALDLLNVPLGRDRALVGGLVVLAAVMVSVAGVVLERACEAPPEDDDDSARGLRE